MLLVKLHIKIRIKKNVVDWNWDWGYIKIFLNLFYKCEYINIIYMNSINIIKHYNYNKTLKQIWKIFINFYGIN